MISHLLISNIFQTMKPQGTAFVRTSQHYVKRYKDLILYTHTHTHKMMILAKVDSLLYSTISCSDALRLDHRIRCEVNLKLNLRTDSVKKFLGREGVPSNIS